MPKKTKAVDNNLNVVRTSATTPEGFANQVYNMADKLHPLTMDDVTYMNSVLGITELQINNESDPVEINQGVIDSNNLNYGVSPFDLYMGYDDNSSIQYVPLSLTVKTGGVVFGINKINEGLKTVGLSADDFEIIPNKHWTIESTDITLPTFDTIGQGLTVDGQSFGLVYGKDSDGVTHAFTYVIDISANDSAKVISVNELANDNTIADLNNRLNEFIEKGIDEEAIKQIIKDSIDEDNIIDQTLIETKVNELKDSIDPKIEGNTSDISKLKDDLAALQESTKLPDNLATKEFVDSAIATALDEIPTVDVI